MTYVVGAAWREDGGEREGRQSGTIQRSVPYTNCNGLIYFCIMSAGFQVAFAPASFAQPPTEINGGY